MKAMIFAAGLGTRFKPWTDKHPKALAPVNGKTLLQRNIEYLQRYGITEVVVNAHHFAEQIIHALKSSGGWGSQFSISDETKEVLETGGGLMRAANHFGDGPFVVLNVDILTDLDLGAMIRFHQHHKPLATLAVTDLNTSRYFLFNDQQELCGWRNTTTGQEKIARQTEPLFQKAFSGIHVIDPEIFSLVRQTGKFSMVDVYLDLAARHPILAYDHSGSRFVDVGRTESLLEAEKLFE
jgi:NDP-sugar pyrophosphorylase family protein